MSRSVSQSVSWELLNIPDYDMIFLFRFLDMHMYVTSALQRTDMKAVGLQLALDLLHEKVCYDTTGPAQTVRIMFSHRVCIHRVSRLAVK